jgi:hypothetical protein
MILREFHEFMRGAGTETEPARHITAAIEGAMRFVFQPGATAACEQLAEHPAGLVAAREQLFAPWPATWIEWEGSPNAIMWLADDESGRTGGCFAVTRRPGRERFSLMPFRVDLTADEFISIPERAHALHDAARSAGLPAIDSRLARDMGLPIKVGRVMLAAWALLATKGMTGRVDIDQGRLNRTRAKRGLYPLLGYAHIRLNLDAERAVRAAGRGFATDTMPLHPVRAHLRLLPTGRVTVVTAHMRGNPERGTRAHHYTVLRAEDAI